MEWTNKNTVEINGVLVEKEWALPPNPTELQKSMMITFIDGKWELAFWNGALDKTGKTAYGWEPCCAKAREEIAELVANLMKDIENEG